MNASRMCALALIALLGVTLAGCEAAEESAQKLTQKAEQAVQELAREAVSDTVNAFNEQVDQVQQSANELLGKPKDKAATEAPEADAEAPQAVALLMDPVDPIEADPAAGGVDDGFCHGGVLAFGRVMPRFFP